MKTRRDWTNNRRAKTGRHHSLDCRADAGDLRYDPERCSLCETSLHDADRKLQSALDARDKQ